MNLTENNFLNRVFLKVKCLSNQTCIPMQSVSTKGFPIYLFVLTLLSFGGKIGSAGIFVQSVFLVVIKDVELYQWYQ